MDVGMGPAGEDEGTHAGFAVPPDTSAQPGGSVTVQLRLGFGQPEVPVELALHLAGLTVVADIWAGRFDEAWQYLLGAGVAARVEAGRGICFSLSELPKLGELPGQVRVTPRGALEVLFGLATTGDGVPATVQVAADGGLLISWYGPAGRTSVPLSDSAATALLASELPFVASEEAWGRLEMMAGFPLAIGRCRVNHDGFIEITTAKPQMVESAPLPGLFRIDDTHFGLARAYEDAVSRLRGFEWEPVPRPVRRWERPVQTGPLQLSAHHQRDLVELVDALVSWGARIVCWEAGLGRRIMALAALEALDAWPALIVAPPWEVWVWQRHFDLAGRRLSLTRGHADARLVTYLDLARGAVVDSFEALVLDDLSGPDASEPGARAALAGLGAVGADWRIGLCSSWPEDPEEACELLDIVRPGEFRLGGSAMAQRYPLAPVARAEEHAAVYLSRRARADADNDPTVFRRSEVRVVPTTPAQRRALEEIATSTADDRDRLGDAYEVLSAGAGSGIAPKIAAAVSISREGITAGKSVAVACASVRSANLLRAALAPVPSELVDAADPVVRAGSVSVVLRRRRAVALGAFDWVVWMEWPWSTETIDLSVGASGTGPERVIVLHSPGTVDDRLAMLAARRREQAGMCDPFVPPADDELPYLLSSRWAQASRSEV